MTGQRERRSRSWRSYASFGVRWQLVLVMVVAGILSWVAHRVGVHARAVDAIKRSGGRVRYQWEETEQTAMPVGSGWWPWLRSSVLGNGSQTSDGQPAEPEWLVAYLGYDYFGDVVSVSLTGRATDDVLDQVGHLTRIERLDLHGSAVTDRGLSRLKGLDRLHNLQLIRVGITDAGRRASGGTERSPRAVARG